MLLYIIRHGETDYNVVRRLQGQTDQPLNQKGIDLAKITGQHMKDIHFDLAITSPLKRAKDTAILVLQESGNPDTPLLEDRRIMELSFGDWEGLCCKEEHYEIPEPNFYQFFKDPFVMKPFPGGEHVRDVIARTADFYQDIIHRPELADKTILISSHGCACRALLNSLYENKEDFWHGHVPYNCAVNIVEVKDGVGHFVEEDKIYYDRGQIVDRYKGA